MNDGFSGRGMKVGKEGIYSSISAVENWYKRNTKNDLFKQKKIISYWLKYLDTKNYQGIGYEVKIGRASCRERV